MNTRHFLAMMLAASFCILGASGAAGGPPDRGTEKLAIEPVDVWAPRPIHVSVWTSRGSYRVGDDVRVFFRVSRDSFFFLFNTDAEGVTRQIFPNRYDPDNYLQAGQTYSIPDHGYNLVATGPNGVETLHGIATTADYYWLRSGYGKDRSYPEPFPVSPEEPAFIYKKLENNVRDDIQHERAKQPQRRSDHRGLAIEVLPPEWCPPAYGQDWTTFRVYGGHDDYPPRPPDECCDYGTLRLSASPYHSDVFINGAYYGSTPLTVELPEGYYEIEVSSRGYATWSRRIRLEANRRESYTVRLRRRW